MSNADRLVEGLSRPSAYPHPCREVRCVETHISWVFLTGERAYKVKKPVDLGFLNFSTLEARRHFCEEELRCNRRFAPELYEAVVSVTSGDDGVVIDGAGTVVDYAVRMRQFPDAAQLDRMLDAGELTVAALCEFAAQLVGTHDALPRAPTDSAWGTAAAVRKPVEENFVQIRRTAYGEIYSERLESLARWTAARHEALATTFDRRRLEGFVRECHGDLHLSNLAALGDAIVAFDCLEFDPALRWIDVLNDVAFLVMDLLARRRRDMGYAALDAYLAAGGDYPGLATFDYYLVYRTLVRAKVAALRAPPEDAAVRERFERHLALAEALALRPRRGLVVTCGLSGSGKSFVAERLGPALGAVRVRSDVERKRLHGLAPEQSSGSTLDAGLYTPSATERVYDRLAVCAEAALAGGQTVIVDATFLDPARRRTFLDLARRLNVPAVVLHTSAPLEVLRQRIRARAQQADDVSEATTEVLGRQFEGFAPPAGPEVLTVETGGALSVEALAVRVRDRLGHASADD